MREVLKRVLKSRVHEGWFILSCALLGAVMMTATLMTWDLSSYADKMILYQTQAKVGHRGK